MMPRTSDLDDVVGQVLDALSNPTRRRILEVLVNEGPLTLSEIMRRCGIRDTSTAKHHIDKLSVLVDKGNGVYYATLLGREAYRILLLLKENVSRIIPLERNPTPLLIIKPTSIPYCIILASIAILMFLIHVFAGLWALLLTPVLVYMGLLAYTNSSRKIIVGKNSVIEIVENIIYRKEKKIMGRLLGVVVENNSLTRILGLVKINLVIGELGELKTFSIGYVKINRSKDYIEDLEKLAMMSSIKSLL